jgi:hypothetical protein
MPPGIAKAVAGAPHLPQLADVGTPRQMPELVPHICRSQQMWEFSGKPPPLAFAGMTAHENLGRQGRLCGAKKTG